MVVLTTCRGHSLIDRSSGNQKGGRDSCFNCTINRDHDGNSEDNVG